jgi:ParB family chromosome partitioning protein
MPREVVTKPVEWCHPDPTQPRKSFDAEQGRMLGESLKLKQLVPLLVKPDGTIIDGERRWRAAKLVGLQTLDVIVTEESLTPAQIKEIQLATSLQRADLKPYELYEGFMEWLKLNPGATAKDLAAKISLHPTVVSRYLSLGRCLPAIQEAARSGALSMSAWAEMAQADEQQQHEMLAARRNGASRDELGRQRKRKETANEPKASRVKIPYQGGEVAVSGKSLGMAEIVEILEAILKDARKAVGVFDIKTFCAMQRDKIKAV